MWPGTTIHVNTFCELCTGLARRADEYALEFGAEAVELSPPSPTNTYGGVHRRKRGRTSAGEGSGEAAASSAHIDAADNDDAGSGSAAAGGTESGGEAPVLPSVVGLTNVNDEVFKVKKRQRRKHAFLQPRNYAPNPCAATRGRAGAPEQEDLGSISQESRLDENEIVLHVQWQHRSRTTKVLEYAVLSSQTLAELADSVYSTDRWCLSSTIEEDERRNSKWPAPTRTPTYIFIEDTFYIDTRERENAKFATESLLPFAHQVTPEGHAKYSVKSMEGTRLRDLRVRPGVKYLFCHCGDCEHALTFTQMRRATNHDRRMPVEMYPLQVWKTRVLQRRCAICDKHAAQWATYDDNMSRTTPGFFCEKCFASAHYSGETGERLFDFKSYRYYHDELQG